VFVNGSEVILNKARTLKDFLESEGYIIDRVAVEKNGRIVPKSLYASVMLNDGDRLEIVSFVGGG